MKSFFKSVLLTSLLVQLVPVTASAVSVTPLNHNSDLSVSGTRTIYFGTTAKAGDACSPATGQKTFTAPNYTTPVLINGDAGGNGVLRFRISNSTPLATITGTSSFASNAVSIRVNSTSNASNTPVALVDDGTGYNNASKYEVSYGQTADGNSTTFGISLSDITTFTGFCNVAGAVLFPSSVQEICQPLAGTAPKVASILIGLVKSGFTLSTADDSISLQVLLADCPEGAQPTGTDFSLPDINFSLIAGDSRVKVVNTSNVTSGSTVPYIGTLIVADTQLNPTLTSTTAVKNGEPAFNSTYVIDNLTNDQQYCFSIGYINAAGFVTTDTSWSNSFPTSSKYTQCVTPSKIDGFLQRSTCFIASATYGEEWDDRLEILRQFRDQVLERSSVGHNFVEWYYGWSPQAAHWILENPGYKSFIRIALMPLVESARVALWLRANIWVFAAMFLLGTAVVVASTSRRRTI